jgi:gp69 protein
MRVDKKEPLSKPAEDLILMKLYKLAGDNEQLAIEILNKSTINSWKDIFPIDKKQGGNKNGNTGNKRSYTRNAEKKGFDKHNDYKPDYSKGFDDWN